MTRPALSAKLSEAEFASWYWLKDELVRFCRNEGLAVSGSKQEVAQRLSAYLAGKKLPAKRVVPRQKGTMPRAFGLDTVIGPGWRCTQELRAFFVAHVGKGFRFNRALRTFISTSHGSKLRDALAHYKESLLSHEEPIEGQFEYNRHMREFHAENPGATHADAVESWWLKRGK